MAKQNEIENSNIIVGIESLQKYKLSFEEDIAQKVRIFCESFFIDLNEFIVNTIDDYLNEISNDIKEKRFDILIGYYNLEKFEDIPFTKENSEVNEKNSIIEAEFPPLISEAIESICDIIHWSPERFIEDIIEWKIKNIMDDIKHCTYDFLDVYKHSDLEKLNELVRHI